MIVLDTHIWIWWVHADSRLGKQHKELLERGEKDGIGVCTISVWEIAKLVERKRLVLPMSIDQWFDNALAYPGVALLNLVPGIAIESTKLPGKFHRDPADQIIVATARVLDCPLLTIDRRLQNYPHVDTP